MRKTGWCVSLLLMMFVTLRAVSAADHYVGHWALTLPDGRAGWLGVSEKEGELMASLLWGGGSVTPVIPTRAGRPAAHAHNHRGIGGIRTGRWSSIGSKFEIGTVT